MSFTAHRSWSSFALAAITVAGTALSAQAGLVADRPTLQGILGGGGTLEDFEGLDVQIGGQYGDDSGSLSSTTTFAGLGPGLVQPGASYNAAALFWNGPGYYGLITKTLGDAAFDRPLTITYSTPVTAMGFDIQGYEGFDASGTVSVFDTSSQLIAVVPVDRGFFGWENSGGIGSVVIAAPSAYILIDNHLFGVPSPAAASLFGLGGLALARRRR
jgi:hypothetical protein